MKFYVYHSNDDETDQGWVGPYDDIPHAEYIAALWRSAGFASAVYDADTYRVAGF